MSVAAMLESLARRGFQLEVRGERLHVEPTPDTATVRELVAHKAALLSTIAAQGGRWPLPSADEHRFLLWSDAVEPTRAACIACGIPPMLHGADALEAGIIVDAPDGVALIDSRAVDGDRGDVADPAL